MTFELKTISTKKFILFALFGALISVAGGIGLGIYFESKIMCIIFLLFFTATTLYFAHIFALSISNIVINENAVHINIRNLLYENISGYFVNETYLTMTAMDLRLKSNEVVSIIGITFGKQNIVFKKFISELKDAIIKKNGSIEELSFSDIYPGQAIGRKTFRFVIIPLVIIFNILSIYLAIRERFFPYQILIINSSILLMIPRLKRKEK